MIDIRYRWAKACVYAGRFQSALANLLFEFVYIKFRGCRFTAEDGFTLTVDVFLLLVLTIDFKSDLLALIREQSYRDLLVLHYHNRLRPDYTAQLQKRFLRSAPSFVYRNPRHLQINRLRKNPLTIHLMVFQEELFSRERRAIALFAQIRGVAVQQGMKYRGGGTVGTRLPAPRRIDPVALFGKGIRRQTHTLRFYLGVELAPIQFQALHPQIHQLGDFLLCHPFVDRLLQIRIVAEQRQRLLVALHLSFIR